MRSLALGLLLSLLVATVALDASAEDVFLVRRDGTIVRFERGYAKDASRSLLAEVRAARGIAPARR